LEPKIFTKIIFPPIAYPVRRRLPALVLGVFIVKLAVQAAVQIAPAMGAYFLAPDLILNLKRFSTIRTNPHHSLYTQ
jgi:hypothetical protein